MALGTKDQVWPLKLGEKEAETKILKKFVQRGLPVTHVKWVLGSTREAQNEDSIISQPHLLMDLVLDSFNHMFTDS